MSANICSLFQGVIATLCSASASRLTTLRLCAGTFAGKREMMSLSGMTLSQSSNGKIHKYLIVCGKICTRPILVSTTKNRFLIGYTFTAIPVSPHCQLLTCSVSVEKGLDLSHNNSES